MARVLVIDDDEGVRHFIVRALERAGYEVREASDGTEGVGLHVVLSADVVVTDLLMDGMEGLETIRALRRVTPGLPVLAISGGGRADAEEVLEVARHLGAARTLRKPFRVQELLDAVQELITDR